MNEMIYGLFSRELRDIIEISNLPLELSIVIDDDGFHIINDDMKTTINSGGFIIKERYWRERMNNNEKELIGIINVLCDAVSDSPCGCDACPYVDSKIDGQCEVYDIIYKIKEGVKNEQDD